MSDWIQEHFGLPFNTSYRSTDHETTEFRLEWPYSVGPQFFDSLLQLRAFVDEVLKTIKRKLNRDLAMIEGRERSDQPVAETTEEWEPDAIVVSRFASPDMGYWEIEFPTGTIQSNEDLKMLLNDVGLPGFVDGFHSAFAYVDAETIPSSYGIALSLGSPNPFRYVLPDGSRSPQTFRDFDEALVAATLEEKGTQVELKR